jgi:hypothetical protein
LGIGSKTPGFWGLQEGRRKKNGLMGWGWEEGEGGEGRGGREREGRGERVMIFILNIDFYN